MRPPQFSPGFDAMSLAPHDRHEKLVEVFGYYLFWTRNSILASTKRLCESREQRERLGKIFQEPYKEVSDMSAEERQVAYKLVEACLDSFAKDLLGLIGNEGLDLRLSALHAVRLRLEMEVCDIPSGDVLLEETIGRGGQRFLPEYMGVWRSKFGKMQANSNASADEST